VKALNEAEKNKVIAGRSSKERGLCVFSMGPEGRYHITRVLLLKEKVGRCAFPREERLRRAAHKKEKGNFFVK
jgi:hypothetical protein